MLTIRKEQFVLFAEIRRRDFERRLLAYLQGVMTDAGKSWPLSRLQGQIGLGIEYGRYCKLTRESEVARFVEIVCTTVGDMDAVWSSKEARSILHDHRFAEQAKLERLAAWAKAQTQ